MHDPVLIAYAVQRIGKRKRKFWTRIGRAFPHDTGAGLTLMLDLIPRDGVIILLERYDDDDAWLTRVAEALTEPAQNAKPAPATGKNRKSRSPDDSNPFY